MRLFVKIMSIMLLVLAVELLCFVKLSSDGNMTLKSVILLSTFSVCLLMLIIYIKILRPISNIVRVIKDIDFAADVVNLRDIDNLKSTGVSEVKTLLDKFKYLLDVVTNHIHQYNCEAYVSEHDALTGCYNRTYLSRMKDTYEQQSKYCIIFIDVNNLKRMNDTLGHDAGDLLLKEAANKLSFWEPYGDVYRLGGDEFMVVIPNTTEAFCRKLLDKWYPTVGVIAETPEGYKCMLSYGIRYVDDLSVSFDDMMEDADKEMYDMKVRIKEELGEELR